MICPDISPLIGDMNPRKTHLFSASFMGIKTSFITGFFWAHLAGMIGLFAQTKLLGSVYCIYCWVVATQIYFTSAPNFGEDSDFGSYFFEMGWFNHQLVLDVFFSVTFVLKGTHRQKITTLKPPFLVPGTLRPPPFQPSHPVLFFFWGFLNYLEDHPI